MRHILFLPACQGRNTVISSLPDHMKKPLTAVNNSLNGKVSDLGGKLSIGQLAIQLFESY